jgi:hypothetical protein
MFMKYPQTICMALFAIAKAGCSYPQTVDRTLLGSVTDASGAVVSGAKVTTTETDTSVCRSRGTDSSGYYPFSALPPGHYTVSVKTPGFKKQVKTNIELLVNTSMPVGFKMQPGDASKVIEVSAGSVIPQTDRTDTGRKVEKKLLENVELATNRKFQGHLNLVLGTVPPSFQHSQFFNASGSLQTQVSGQFREGNHLIEGTDDNERTGLLWLPIPPIAAIQILDTPTSSFDAEMGRATGTVTNVVVKSDKNAFSGAYEVLQNSDLNACSLSNPPVAYNYVGGNISGPVRRSKVSFSVEYPRTMDHEGSATVETIPSLVFRSGDLSADSTQVIYGPANGYPFTDDGRRPIPGNEIPITPNQSFNAAARANNYNAALPFRKTTDSLDDKMDFNSSDNDRLTARISFARLRPFFKRATTESARHYSARLKYRITRKRA